VNQHQSDNSPEKNNSVILKKSTSINKDDGDFDFNALWLDPFSPPTELHKKSS
jgi:hypothetical protein